jgi:restriction endonuclease Mrr
MSAPKNWKANAYATLADYHKLLGERASIDDRIEEALERCERAGVTVERSYGSVEATVEAREVVACKCGALIPQPYAYQQKPRAEICRFCAEQVKAAVVHDTEAEKETTGPTPPPAEQEIPF